MGRVATPPPGVAGGAAAAELCGRATGVGVAASQQGRDALCCKAKWRSWKGSFASVHLYDVLFLYLLGPSF